MSFIEYYILVHKYDILFVLCCVLVVFILTYFITVFLTRKRKEDNKQFRKFCILFAFWLFFFSSVFNIVEAYIDFKKEETKEYKKWKKVRLCAKLIE